MFFIVSIQLLLSQSQRDGALIFANGNLNFWQMFVSQYMATVASVVYSILLGLIDLDAKRLEPYFQLSKEQGAAAKDSLLLHYPFDFLAFVPFTALKRRYYLSSKSPKYTCNEGLLIKWE